MNFLISIFAVVGSIAIQPVCSFSTLITFDVDGTLVSSSPGWERGAHGRSFVHAVNTILGKDSSNNNASSTMVVAKKALTIPEVLEKHEFHGSTDGLILLRLARNIYGSSSSSFDNDVASSRVNDMMDEMFQFVSKCDDEEVSMGIAPLPGVLNTLQTLASEYTTTNTNGAATAPPSVACGLVTGNVEGIARRKMTALGIHATNAFTPLPEPQGGRVWDGVEDVRFLGGFGSDYCSGNVEDPARNYLDRGEQLAICVRRCVQLSTTEPNSGSDRDDGDSDDQQQQQYSSLDKVIHVGDAPADILAAKSYAFDHPDKPPGVCVSVVGVATGSYSVEELRKLCGESVPGVWEPVVLEQGMGVGDEHVFLKACGLV